MKPTHLTLFGAFALAATGCAGDFSSGGSDINPNSGTDAGVEVEAADAAPPSSIVSSAQALFEANVSPIISATCNPNGACHGSQDPAFISAQPGDAYATINIHRDRLFPGYKSAGSALLANGAGGHQGALFSADDVGAIQAWLAQEALDASGGPTNASAMAVWSGCMKLEQWDEYNVANLWADKNANNQGDCDACHNLGAEGFMASNQSQRVFDTITKSPALMPSYFTLNAAGTAVVVNRARLESVGNQLSPHEAHGSYQLNDGAMEALLEFYNATKLNVEAGDCDPPRF